MTKEELYYTWKWFEEGSIILLPEMESIVVNEMCLRGM